MAMARTSLPPSVMVILPLPACTVSLKVRTMLAFAVTPVSPSVGDVALKVGGVVSALAVSEKSSIARPSSAPDALASLQRRAKVAPFAILSAEIVDDKLVKNPMLLPTRAPADPVVSGVMKSSGFQSSQVPVVELRGIQAVLKIELIRAARCAEAPFLPLVGNGERRDRAAGIVVEEDAERRNQGSTLQSAEGAVGRSGDPVAVTVAGPAAAGIDGVLLVVPRAPSDSVKDHPVMASVLVVLPAVLDSVSKSCV